MIGYLIAAACGAIAAVAYPPANALAVRLRDYLYGLFRKGSDESDEAGAIETRELRGVILHYQGVPVEVTGTAATHSANWLQIESTMGAGISPICERRTNG